MESLIRNVWFRNNGLILAPMVRVGTLPFRILAVRNGADVVFTEELISFKLAKCKRVINEELNTVDFVQEKNNEVVLRICEEEKNKLILQIGASDPEIALKAALLVQDDVIGVDVNMGCPKHFSTHGNMGSNLLYLPDIATSILRKLRENVKEEKFVSCKIRLLDDDDSTSNFINAIQSTGIDFFTVHFRTKYQTAKNKADWGKLSLIKKLAKIPFFANGDIFNYEDYKKVIKYSNGVMLARGAIHNPAIFNQIKEKSLKESLVLDLKEDHNEELTNDYKEFPEKEDENEDKNEKNNNKKLEVQESNKLAKVLENKYKDEKIDILPKIKELIQLGIKYNNQFHNTKYNVLYILKTHKNHKELFNKLSHAKDYSSLHELVDK